VLNGVLDSKNGKPALFFEQVRTCDMLLTSAITETANTKIIVGANKSVLSNGLIAYSDINASGNASTIGCFPAFGFYLFNSLDNLYIKSPPPAIDTNQQLLIGGDDGSTAFFRKDANAISISPTSQVISKQLNVIGRYGGVYGNSLTQEIIHYPNSQFSNINGIENNINTYYGIY
jgi:hypothetical protein